MKTYFKAQKSIHCTTNYSKYLPINISHCIARCNTVVKRVDEFLVYCFPAKQIHYNPLQLTELFRNDDCTGKSSIVFFLCFIERLKLSSHRKRWLNSTHVVSCWNKISLSDKNKFQTFYRWNYVVWVVAACILKEILY